MEDAALNHFEFSQSIFNPQNYCGHVIYIWNIFYCRINLLQIIFEIFVPFEITADNFRQLAK